MQARFRNARFIAVLIIIVGGLGLITWFLFNQNAGGVFGFNPQQWLFMSILWLVVGVLLLLFLSPGEEPTVDPQAISRFESQIRTFDNRFKDMDARLDARVADVDNRFSRRVTDYETRLQSLETGPRTMGFARVEPDNLQLIEGVGPQIAQALRAAGIETFTALAQASQDALRAALDRANISFAPSMDTWPRQAQYLADGDTAGFQAYVAQLTAGRD